MPRHHLMQFSSFGNGGIHRERSGCAWALRCFALVLAAGLSACSSGSGGTSDPHEDSASTDIVIQQASSENFQLNRLDPLLATQHSASSPRFTVIRQPEE